MHYAFMQGEEIGKGDEGKKKTFASRIQLKYAFGNNSMEDTPCVWGNLLVPIF